MIIEINVGMSYITIACHNIILIGNNVVLIVGTQKRDTYNQLFYPENRHNSNVELEN